MAVTSGTVQSCEVIKANDRDPLFFAAVYFTMSGTYDTSLNSILTGVAALIQDSRRNGKTVTMKTVGLWQPARKSAAPEILLGLKTVAISTNDVTFEVTLGSSANVLDISTEFTNSTALPTQSVPFGILVGFTEA